MLGLGRRFVAGAHFVQFPPVHLYRLEAPAGEHAERWSVSSRKSVTPKRTNSCSSHARNGRSQHDSIGFGMAAVSAPGLLRSPPTRRAHWIIVVVCIVAFCGRRVAPASST